MPRLSPSGLRLESGGLNVTAVAPATSHGHVPLPGATPSQRDAMASPMARRITVQGTGQFSWPASATESASAVVSPNFQASGTASARRRCPGNGAIGARNAAVAVRMPAGSGSPWKLAGPFSNRRMPSSTASATAASTAAGAQAGMSTGSS